MTTDVDAIIRCPEDLTDFTVEVGADYGLESNWLNNQVKAFASPVVDIPSPLTSRRSVDRTSVPSRCRCSPR